MMRLMAVLVVASLTSAAMAADRPGRLGPVLGGPVLGQVPPSPVPETDSAYVITPQPTPVMPAPVVVAPTLAVYSNVRYKDAKNVHPRGITRVVQVADPCNKCGLVNVAVCVPPCACERVKVSKNGGKVKLDYGDYEVEITSRRGYVVVDYDD